MTENVWNAQIAEKLHFLRKEKSWSLDKASKATGISKAMLGQIERGESSPTINTLWKLATGFNISFSSFFSEVKHIPSGNVKVLSQDKEMEVTTLFPFEDGINMEVFEIKVKGPKEHLSNPHFEKAVEHIIVLEGRLKVLFGGEWTTLQKGETARFSADQHHGYCAETPEAIFHNIIYYP